MIDFYYAPTPNGWKVAIMLEECGLAYTTHLLRLARGDQFKPEFRTISPNAKMPAIVDHDPPEAYGGAPVSVFEFWARSCCTWRRKPAGSCQAMPWVARRRWSGCSGRWATRAPWPGS